MNNQKKIPRSSHLVNPASDKKVPELRFPEFSEEWEKKKLGNVSNFFDAKRIPLSESQRQNKQGSYPYYGASGIIDYVDDYIFDGEYVLLGEDGANIINRSTRLAFLVSGKFWVNNHAHVIKAKGNNVFLSESLERINYNKYNTGTAQPKLNAEVCKKIPLYITTLPEQTKIANFLSAVDKKIENQNLLIENLKRYKKGIMQQIFSQEIRFKDEKGNDFPDWEEKRLGDYLIHKNIRNKKNKVNLVLSVSNRKGFIKQTEQFEGYQVASKDLSNYKIVSKDDYGYNPARINVGSIARLKENYEGIISPMYVVFKLKEQLNKLFFDNLLQAHYFKYLIKIGCSGSVRDSLNYIDMANFKIQLPSLPEQKKIADFLSALDRKIENEKLRMDNLKEWKKGLLQKMFV